MNFTPCQQAALDAIGSGGNVLITGPGGTGKSFLLEQLKRQTKGPYLDVTATTGIAALNVGGVTIHSWAGLGLGDTPLDQIELAIRQRPRVVRRIMGADRLAVDEVSMASAELLDLLDGVLQRIRGDDRPFGGVQMLFFGDFLQLPPVSRSGAPARFAFDSAAWKKAKIQTVQLRTVVRQTDAEFAGLLHRVREGVPTSADLEVLKSRVSAPRPTEGPSPVRLFNTNKDVDAFNWGRLCALEGDDAFEYEAVDIGEEFALATLRKNCIAPERLTLRTGAQVMLLKNISFDDGLVNGTVGIVEGFDAQGVPTISFGGLPWRGEKHRWEMKQGYTVVASREQYPLRLAWGITTHKSQGMTLDPLEVDLGSCFERGQAYVALSRAKRLEGLWISKFDPASILAHPKALEFYGI